MGDIGPGEREYELEPLPEKGVPEPIRTPAPQQVPEEVPA